MTYAVSAAAGGRVLFRVGETTTLLVAAYQRPFDRGGRVASPVT